MGRQAPLIVVVVALAATGLILGGLLVSEPGVVIPLALESILLILVTGFVLGLEKDADQRSWLTRLLLAAGAIRIGVIMLVYGVLSPGIFASDAASYEMRGQIINDYWRGLRSRPDMLDRWQKAYEVMNAWGVRILDDPTWALVVLNTFAGMWTIILTYFIARRCFGVSAAKFSAALVTVFPSMVLWSVLNIRDALTMALVTLLVFLGVRTYGRIRLTDLAWFGLGVLILSTFRDYMSFLVLAGLVLGTFAAARPGRVFSTLVMGVVATLGSLFLLERTGVFSPELLSDPLAQVQTMRSGLQQDFVSGLAGSAYGTDVQIRSMGDAVRFLPMGLTYFLFAPFPWMIRSVLQLTTLPEVLLWYFLVPFLVVGVLSARKRESSVSLLVFGVLLLTVCSYALVEGNFGTAYRHRAQIMPLFFVFCGQGLSLWWEARRKKIRSDRARQSQAKRQLILSGPRR